MSGDLLPVQGLGSYLCTFVKKDLLCFKCFKINLSFNLKLISMFLNLRLKNAIGYVKLSWSTIGRIRIRIRVRETSEPDQNFIEFRNTAFKNCLIDT